MCEFRVGREDVTAAVRRALEPREYVLAMWEGGAAAFDRIDEWSDIDLQVLCEDGRVDEVFEDVRNALEELSPIDRSFRLPEPTWHGHSQIFHRLRDASMYLVLDFVAMQRGSDKDRFLQPEIHGRPLIYFDKRGDLSLGAVDAAEHAAKLRARIERHRAVYDLFKPFVRKELNRGNTLEAMGYYQATVLRPLVELLRIAHSPLRYDFHTRYVHYELPADVVERLQGLFYVSDERELSEKCDQADKWVAQLLDSLGDGPDERSVSGAISRELAGHAGQRRVSS